MIVSVVDVRGWKRAEAESALREAGVARMEGIVVSPPRGRASGDQRVLCQARRDDGAIILTIAREMVRDDTRVGQRS